MKAVIVSSGDGTRLRPITCSIPHSMLPVMGRPVIEHTVRLLARHNIKNITIASSYLSEEIKKHFSFNPIENVKIDFTDELNFENYFRDDDAVLISDSILCDTDMSEIIAVHTHCGCDVTAVTKHSKEVYRYGVLYPGKEGLSTAYNRCPDYTKLSGIPFTGIVVVRQGIKLSDCKDFQTMLEKLESDKHSIYCYTPDSYIRDISDFESYQRACRDFMDKKIKLPFCGVEKAPSVWIDESATVMQGAVLSSPVYIGKGSVINKGARIEAYSQILNDVTVDCYSSIKRSIVMDNSYISESASLRGTIIGKNCHMGYESAAYEGSVLGFGGKIGKNATLRTSVHVWPDKFIEDESYIAENIVWNDISKPLLLGISGAEGILNFEITPEFALGLARAVVSFFGTDIAVSCEGDGAGIMIKNALIAGIQSGGGKAYDMGEQPLPITRSAVRFYSLHGGIALSVYQQNSTVYGFVDIINSQGISPDREDVSKINRIIEDFSSHKALAQDIREPEYLFEYKLYYLKQLINSTSKKELGAKVLIDCSSPWATELLKSAATDLKCKFDFTAQNNITEFAKKVSAGGYDLGAVCDVKCEKLTLVTGTGKILSEYEYDALTSLIIMQKFENAAVYVPESAPDSIDKLAQEYGATVERTEISPPYLMHELSKSDQIQFLHQFIYRFDAVGAIIILLDYLYTKDVSVEQLLQKIPVSYIVTSTVSCPKQKQKESMHKLYNKYSAQIPKTADSVKVNFKNGWVLVVPDRENSHIKVISHALTTEYAQEINDICIDNLV